MSDSVTCKWTPLLRGHLYSGSKSGHTHTHKQRKLATTLCYIECWESSLSLSIVSSAVDSDCRSFNTDVICIRFMSSLAPWSATWISCLPFSTEEDVIPRSCWMLDFSALCCLPLLLHVLVFIDRLSCRGIWSLFSFSSSLPVSIKKVQESVRNLCTNYMHLGQWRVPKNIQLI